MFLSSLQKYFEIEDEKAALQDADDVKLNVLRRKLIYVNKWSNSPPWLGSEGYLTRLARKRQVHSTSSPSRLCGQWQAKSESLQMAEACGPDDILNATLPGSNFIPVFILWEINVT